MTYKNVSLTSYAVKYGLLIAVVCIVYFLIMRLVKFHYVVELSLLNAVIVIIGIFVALRNFKKDSNGKIKYLDGLGLGFLTSLIAGLVFGIFMVVYASMVSDDFMTMTNVRELLYLFRIHSFKVFQFL